MQFRLVYEGRLRANGDAGHKHEIRRALQPQLRELWTHPPLDTKSAWLSHPPAENDISVIQNLGAFAFAPLVSDHLNLVAELEVVLLRPTRPGALIRQGGDMDNQLKTLFDALRCPNTPAEIPANDMPGEGETPFHCLLDDDERIVELRVATDRFLNAPDPRFVHVSIFVRTRPTLVTWGNLALA